MDPMEMAEEERRRKEQFEMRDLEDAVGIDVDKFLYGRDLTNKGKDVSPSGKQTKFVQLVSASLRLPSQSSSRRKSVGEEGDGGDIGTDNTAWNFDLMSVTRILLHQGTVNKKEPDGFLRRFSRKYLFLFNDVILVTTARKEGGVEVYDLNNVLYLRDMKIRPCLGGDGEDDRNSFELIINKPRSRGTPVSFTIACDSEPSKLNWVMEIETSLLAYHRETPKLGWFHDIIVGNVFATAHAGDVTLLRKHLRSMERTGESVDVVDASGMAPIHWAVLGGHEVCVRLLLDRGADVDCLQGGGNTPLLLAACRGDDALVRLLIDRGADIHVNNQIGRDAVFMAVVYGHSAKGLPWVLQIFHDKGLDLNKIDSYGATPLHTCAERNLARPVRMLVDAGADVNARHGRTLLTPLLMACNQLHPDVETIRSFLDKGAYPNWRDVQGRTAFDLILYHQMQPTVLGEGEFDNSKSGKDRWREMDTTIEEVGHFVLNALPALLEISKKGGRYEQKNLDCIRPSLRSAVLEARESWEKRCQPSNFLEFVRVREQTGEDLLVHRGDWTKDAQSNSCQLCTASFGMTARRHHCRSCGALVCDSCSSKRLVLTVVGLGGGSPATLTKEAGSSSSSSGKQAGQTPRRGDAERVCDGCFNRLCHEASQPSPDHFRVRQLRQIAIDLANSLSDLVDALDDPDGDPNSFQASLRETIALTKGLDHSPRQSFKAIGSPAPPPPPAATAAAALLTGVDAIKLRESKLQKAEDLVTKFLESADGYHRVAKKLLEQKMNSNRLWGANS